VLLLRYKSPGKGSNYPDAKISTAKFYKSLFITKQKILTCAFSNDCTKYRCRNRKERDTKKVSQPAQGLQKDTREGR
jgi:hypothetical protein